MDGKARVAQLRQEVNEARDGANPTHAATLGIEAIVRFIEDMVAGDSADGQVNEQGMGQALEQTQSLPPAPITDNPPNTAVTDVPASGAQTDAEGTKTEG